MPNPKSKQQKIERPKIKLSQIATARSGDKGNHANIGIVAFTDAGYQFLEKTLTATAVQSYFSGLEITSAERFVLPNVWAMNFLLFEALAGGASQSLRIDTQGKLLGTAILEMEFDQPDNLDAMLKSN